MEHGRKWDTLVRLAKRKFRGGNWYKNSVLTAEQAEALLGETSGGSGGRKKPTIRESRKVHFLDAPEKPAPQTPEPARKKQPPTKGKFKMPSLSLSDFLAVVIYSHTALVWYEVTAIFSTPGAMAGVILAALKHSAVMATKHERFERFASDALGVAFVLDGLAVYAHYTAFRAALPQGFLQQMGSGGAFWAALILASVVACGAFVSLLFISEIRKSNQ